MMSLAVQNAEQMVVQSPGLQIQLCFGVSTD